VEQEFLVLFWLGGGSAMISFDFAKVHADTSSSAFIQSRVSPSQESILRVVTSPNHTISEGVCQNETPPLLLLLVHILHQTHVTTFIINCPSPIRFKLM
jgi:hypothetical protein